MTAGSLGLDLAADDRLHVDDQERRQHDRVDRPVRPGAMAPLAANDDADRGRAGERGPGAVADGSDRLVGPAVERQGEIGLGEPGIEPVGEHLPGPTDGLFGGLSDHDHRSRPAVAMIGQPAGGADEAAHVNVVPAGVHHADLTPGLVVCLRLAGIGQPGLFDDRQRVHVGSNQDDRPITVFQNTHDPELADVGRHVSAGFGQLVGDSLRRFDLLTRQLGVGVQMRVERNQLGQPLGDPWDPG